MLTTDLIPLLTFVVQFVQALFCHVRQIRLICFCCVYGVLLNLDKNRNYSYHGLKTPEI